MEKQKVVDKSDFLNDKKSKFVWSIIIKKKG
jgi:hypothetical protein